VSAVETWPWTSALPNFALVWLRTGARGLTLITAVRPSRTVVTGAVRIRLLEDAALRAYR